MAVLQLPCSLEGALQWAYSYAFMIIFTKIL